MNPTLAACEGNCDTGAEVTVDELIRGVNIALGVLALDACRAADTNGDGTVTINELIKAVNNALYGCGVTPPTPLPTPTRTATATYTPSPTFTLTPTATPTATFTRPPTPTATATRTRTVTPTPNPRCVNIAGTWSGTERGSVTCSGGGDSETVDIDYPGSVTITQNDCNVSYTIPGTNFVRSGRVNGSTLHVEGPCLDESLLEQQLEIQCTFSRNVTAGDGTIQGSTISATGRCTVNGVCDGIAGSCSGTTTVSLARLSSEASRATLREPPGQEPALPLPGSQEALQLGLMTVVH